MGIDKFYKKKVFIKTTGGEFTGIMINSDDLFVELKEKKGNSMIQRHSIYYITDRTNREPTGRYNRYPNLFDMVTKDMVTKSKKKDIATKSKKIKKRKIKK